MGSLPKHILTATALVSLVWSAEEGGAAISSAMTHKFRTDDPLWQEPPPRPVAHAGARAIDPLYDFVSNSFGERGERHQEHGERIRSRGVNTLDEAPDSCWYTNRHARRRMSREELMRGPGNTEPPRQTHPWRIVGAKADGVTPGFLIEDSQQRRYLLKFDPPRHPEMASAADVIGSKIFYALGYWTPENYIVRFERDQLRVDPQATYRDASGHTHALTERQVNALLSGQPRDGRGCYRALASRILPGTILGPFRYRGTRADDPNDLIPHEDRRDLRGLAVMAAWLNHTDAKAINTLDTLVDEDGRRFVRHFLIDFGAALGSDSYGPKDPSLRHEYFVELAPTVRQVATLGLFVPRWARVRYPQMPAVGRFTAEGFAPEKWKPNYPNPAFSRLQPEDAFWAAKQVVAFRDEDIRALVATGEYSDPNATDYVARTLMQRRDSIGKAYLTQFLPLDGFAVANDQLTFKDLLAERGLGSARQYSISWSQYDNETSSLTPVGNGNGSSLPESLRRLSSGQYAAAKIRYVQPSDSEQAYVTTVYVRRELKGWNVVAAERRR